MNPTPPPKQPYEKPWISWSDQVSKLESRGIFIENRVEAEKLLSQINYYRFSGYCLAFELDRHRIQSETSFDCIRISYEFDCALRNAVQEALEIIEIHFRTTVAYRFSEQHGPMGHTDQANFYTPKKSNHRSPEGQFIYANWLNTTRSECGRAKELFVKHFEATYNDYPNLPIWVATEIMSFGNLSRMYKGMLKPDRKNIATEYGLQPNDLENWIHHLVYIRNTCAHHARLWDRKWHIQPTRLHAKSWAEKWIPTTNQLFITLLILLQMLKKCRWNDLAIAKWRANIHLLLKSPPPVDGAQQMMGLPENWESNPLWK